ncbi:MAG: hypothetical protein ACO37D_08620, partial [Rhodothermales bacterium]
MVGITGMVTDCLPRIRSAGRPLQWCQKTILGEISATEWKDQTGMWSKFSSSASLASQEAI